jgi:NADH dehydrogenase [ubiquinone] 1 alpha subcomplex assembly factor 7
LGPGRGTLMADILRVCAKVPELLAALTLHLVETNQQLRASQRQSLSRHDPIWHDNLSTVPDGPSLIIGNEFLDCMPIRQFVLTETGWHEKKVGCDEAGRLCFGLGPSLPLPPQVAISSDPLCTVREVAPQLPSFIAQLAYRFENNVGRAILIDYGDPLAQPGDTLQALYNHTKSHPLDHVGCSDLTAHVDFSVLQSLAQKAGLDCPQTVSQRTFLQSLGIEARAQALIAANPHCANDVQGAVERLIGQAHMGALFRVACIDSRQNEGRGPPLGL